LVVRTRLVSSTGYVTNAMALGLVSLFLIALLLNACGGETAIAHTPTSTPPPTPTVAVTINPVFAKAVAVPDGGCAKVSTIQIESAQLIQKKMGQITCMEGIVISIAYNSDKVSIGFEAHYDSQLTMTEALFTLVILNDKLANSDRIALNGLKNHKIRAVGIAGRYYYDSATNSISIPVEKPEQIQDLGN